MRGVERFLVLVAVVYMAVYAALFFTLFVIDMASGTLRSPMPWSLLPLHAFGMVLNVTALVLTIRDLYLRSFPKENAKLTWLLLILLTGGVGWLVYIFKHAMKPRQNRVSDDSSRLDSTG